MSESDLVRAPWPPEDGRSWDAQCARCGSSAVREECENCGGSGYFGHECGDDSCCYAYPDDTEPCDICRGAGGWMRCLSNDDWCETNPLPGREDVHGIEWYPLPEARPA